MTRLPCLAVQQPFASLIVSGVKDVENRNKPLPSTLVGQWCAIYASKTIAPVGSWIDAMDMWHRSSVMVWPWPATEIDEFDRAHPWPHHEVNASRKAAVRGAVVGLVSWATSQRLYRSGETRSPWAQPGAHHWTYSERIVLPEPVPLPDGGQQSVPFYLDEQTTRLVIAAAADERLLVAA